MRRRITPSSLNHAAVVARSTGNPTVERRAPRPPAPRAGLPMGCAARGCNSGTRTRAEVGSASRQQPTFASVAARRTSVDTGIVARDPMPAD